MAKPRKPKTYFKMEMSAMKLLEDPSINYRARWLFTYLASKLYKAHIEKDYKISELAKLVHMDRNVIRIELIKLFKVGLLSGKQIRGKVSYRIHPDVLKTQDKSEFEGA